MFSTVATDVRQSDVLSWLYQYLLGVDIHLSMYASIGYRNIAETLFHINDDEHDYTTSQYQNQNIS